MDESALGTEGMVEVKEEMLSEDNLPGDPSAGPSERPGTSINIPNEKPFPLNSLGVGNLGSLGLDSLNSLNTLRADEKRDAIKHGKLPLFLDMPLPPMLDSSNSVFLGRSANTYFLNPNRGLNLSNPMGIDILGISSSEDNLPHWLRDVVTVPTVKSPEPPTLPPTVPMGIDILGISSSENNLPHWLRDVVTVPTVKSPEPPTLPPTVSATQSVRILYGEDSTTISPFVIPDPPPHAPRDPRHSLRKKRKRKLHSSSQKTTDIGSSSHNAVESSSQGHLQTSSTPHLPPPSLAGETSGSSQPNLPPHNLNSTEPLSSAEAIRFPPPEENSVIAAAPSVAHGPSLEGITGTTKSISLDSKSSEPKSTNQDGDLDPETDEKIEFDRIPLHSDKPLDEKQESENALNKQAESQNTNAEEEEEEEEEGRELYRSKRRTNKQLAVTTPKSSDKTTKLVEMMLGFASKQTEMCESVVKQMEKAALRQEEFTKQQQEIFMRQQESMLSQQKNNLDQQQHLSTTLNNFSNLVKKLVDGFMPAP